LLEADQMIGGGPSVLYDAVALLPSSAEIEDLVKESTARDFVADAFAHCKFIGYTSAATALFEKAGIAEADYDEGIVALTSAKTVAAFVESLGRLRVWDREPKVKMK
jgi:catalase